jgi:branched-subunit amino acid transport protein
MPTGTLIAIIVVAGAGTFLARLSFLALARDTKQRSLAQIALRFVPVAVLPALIIPSLFINEGALYLSLSNFRLLAGIVAIVVARFTKSILLTILAGMGSLWLLQALLA